ncbi:MAG: 2-amino-4-hydroxy-6-hydroxymethyldihydropteridine diphosphokinase [Betaproteobacteria bacterium]|nr:2-amino-4-hydroxy-6-hydroxymethyldihydropteridine diphosphokinase [Betaproteobacteria bacterium]
MASTPDAADNPGAIQAFIGIGANLGDPQEQVRIAFRALATLPDTRLLATSAIYRTSPVGAAGQPDYFNAVARLETRLAPAVLLAGLLEIEGCYGRVRTTRNAPRTLDLDLLLYGALRIDQPGLNVPHPRMHLRRFVLEPLAEIAPAAEVPGRGSASQLLAAVMEQAVTRT